jgi:hypothetical protein
MRVSNSNFWKLPDDKTLDLDIKDGFVFKTVTGVALINDKLVMYIK